MIKMYYGAVVVSYEGFVQAIPGAVGTILMDIWVIIMAVLMWRNSLSSTLITSARTRGFETGQRQQQ